MQSKTQTTSHATGPQMSGAGVALAAPVLPGSANTSEEVKKFFTRYPWAGKTGKHDVDTLASQFAYVSVTSFLTANFEQVQRHDPDVYAAANSDIRNAIMGNMARSSDIYYQFFVLTRYLLLKYFGVERYSSIDHDPAGASHEHILMGDFTPAQRQEAGKELRRLGVLTGRHEHQEPALYFLLRAQYPGKFGYLAPHVFSPSAKSPPGGRVDLFSHSGPIQPVMRPSQMVANPSLYPEGTGDLEAWYALRRVIEPEIFDPKEGDLVDRLLDAVKTGHPLEIAMRDCSDAQVDAVLNRLARSENFTGAKIRILRREGRDEGFWETTDVSDYALTGEPGARRIEKITFVGRPGIEPRTL